MSNKNLITEVTEIFEKTPKEIARSPEDRAKIVAYLRQIRASVAAAESAGKRVTAKTKQEKPKPEGYEGGAMSIIANEA